jgi:hypothetical protein
MQHILKEVSLYLIVVQELSNGLVNQMVSETLRK